jgi:hypothetical protein
LIVDHLALENRVALDRRTDDRRLCPVHPAFAPPSIRQVSSGAAAARSLALNFLLRPRLLTVIMGATRQGLGKIVRRLVGEPARAMKRERMRTMT